MAKLRVTPAEFVEKHNRRTKAALEDLRRGVEAVTEAPGAKAAAKADKMRANLLEALDSGKWQRRVARGARESGAIRGAVAVASGGSERQGRPDARPDARGFHRTRDGVDPRHVQVRVQALTRREGERCIGNESTCAKT